MITLLLGLLVQAPPAPTSLDRVMACYIQEDDLSKTDPQNPGQANPVGPKYLIAWKFRPLENFGISKASMEVHDPHKFLNGNSFAEQNFSSKGTGFFAKGTSGEIFMIGVMADMKVGQLSKAQFVRTKQGKLAGMGFGYCQVDSREGSTAFDFWKNQSETLP